MMVDLSDQERRMLTLAMATTSLANLIVDQGDKLDEETLSECERQLGDASLEFDSLFDQLDQPTLVKKLASPLDPLGGNSLSLKLRKELLDGHIR